MWVYVCAITDRQIVRVLQERATYGYERNRWGKSITGVYLDAANLAVAAAQARLAMSLALADYRVVLGGDLVGHGGMDG